MVKLFQNSDLSKKCQSLIKIHLEFGQNLDRSLNLSVTADAEADLASGEPRHFLADAVILFYIAVYWHEFEV